MLSWFSLLQEQYIGQVDILGRVIVLDIVINLSLTSEFNEKRFIKFSMLKPDERCKRNDTAYSPQFVLNSF